MTCLRYALCLVTVLSVAAGPAGAAGEDDAPAQSRESFETLKQKWNETMDALGSYTAEQRDQALEAGRDTLDAMDERLEKMEAWTKKHWNSMSENTRDERSAMLKEMREQRNNVAEWYGGMKHSSADAWDSAKQGFIKSYGELQEAYGNAVDAFQSDDESGEQDSSAD